MPLMKQFSIFVQNKVGSLSKLCSRLSQDKINIIAVSVVDDLEWGIVRLVVDDPEKTKLILQDLGMMYGESQVLAIKLKNHPGALAELADKLTKKKINIDQAFATATGGASIIIVSTTDDKKASTIIDS